QHEGFAKKNDELLQQLEDPDTLARLLLLPEQLADWAERARPGSVRPDSHAVMMSLAVALAILRCAPMRIANLAGLRLDRHLTRPGGPRSRWLIVIPAADKVKNKVQLSYLLNREATVLVDRFIERHRFVLAGPGNPYLFPVGA